MDCTNGLLKYMKTTDVRICALTSQASKIDSTWGQLIRECNYTFDIYHSRKSLVEALVDNSYDIFIIENDLGDIKGHVLISHLRNIGKLPFTSITILCSSAPMELFQFKPIDQRADVVCNYPFNVTSAKTSLIDALKKHKSEEKVRYAFQSGDHNKVSQVAGAISKKNTFCLEIFYESESRYSNLDTSEARLYQYINEKIWPSYILARHYLSTKNLQKLTRLISFCRNIYKSNIGLSYLYFQGHSLLKELEFSKSDFTVASEEFLQLPEYLFWIAQHEYIQKNFKKAVNKQVEAINSVKDTIFESKDSYTDLQKFTNEYICQTDFDDIETVSKAVACIKEASDRDFVDESISVAAKMFDIRAKMLSGDTVHIGKNIVELTSVHIDYLEKYPHVISDTLKTIYGNASLSSIEYQIQHELVRANRMTQEFIEKYARKFSIPKRIKALIDQACIEISSGNLDDAEDKLSKVLGTKPGHFEASCLSVEISLSLIQRGKGFAKGSHMKKIFSILECISNPNTEWEKSRLSDLKSKAESISLST